MQKKKGSQGLMAIEIDMQKGFSRVDWRVLSRIIARFSFSAKVVGLLDQCFAGDSLDILLNGSVVGSVKPKTGIRHGDPLSHFLFIIFMELLAHLLYKLKEERKIQGIKISRTSTTISHFLFDEDIMLFCRANKKNTSQIDGCLDRFCRWIGHSINLSKSGYSFFRNTSPGAKANIKHILNMK